MTGGTQRRETCPRKTCYDTAMTVIGLEVGEICFVSPLRLGDMTIYIVTVIEEKGHDGLFS